MTTLIQLGVWLTSPAHLDVGPETLSVSRAQRCCGHRSRKSQFIYLAVKREMKPAAGCLLFKGRSCPCAPVLAECILLKESGRLGGSSPPPLGLDPSLGLATAGQRCCGLGGPESCRNGRRAELSLLGAVPVQPAPWLSQRCDRSGYAGVRWQVLASRAAVLGIGARFAGENERVLELWITWCSWTVPWGEFCSLPSQGSVDQQHTPKAQRNRSWRELLAEKVPAPPRCGVCFIFTRCVCFGREWGQSVLARLGHWGIAGSSGGGSRVEQIRGQCYHPLAAAAPGDPGVWGKG